MTPPHNVVQAYNDKLAECLAGRAEVRSDLAAFLQPQLEWRFPASVAKLGAPVSLDGRDAMLDFLAAGVEGFYLPGSISFDWDYFPGSGDWVTARLHMTAVTLAGQPYSNEYLLLYELQGGQIARVTEMFDTTALQRLASQVVES